MLRFVLGMLFGVLAALLAQRSWERGELEARLGDLQDRANGLLAESRRSLEETRQEVRAAVESGLKRLEEKAEQARRASRLAGEPAAGLDAEPTGSANDAEEVAKKSSENAGAEPG